MTGRGQLYDRSTWDKITKEELKNFMIVEDGSTAVCFKIRGLIFDPQTAREFIPIMEAQVAESSTQWREDAWTKLLSMLAEELQQEDREKVMACMPAVPTGRRKGTVKERAVALREAWERLIDARCRMTDMLSGRVSQRGESVQGGVAGLVEASPEPAQGRRASRAPTPKTSRKDSKAKKSSKSKRSRHEGESETDGENSQDGSEEEAKVTNPEQKQVVKFRKAMAGSLHQFLAVWHKRDEAEKLGIRHYVISPFALAHEAVWAADNRAADVSRHVLSAQMRAIMEDRDIALDVHPFWGSLIKSSRAAVRALQALDAKYGQDLHFKLANGELSSEEISLLLEWESLMAAIRMCNHVPKEEASMGTKAWFMEVRLKVYEYMYLMAVNLRQGMIWEMPPRPSAVGGGDSQRPVPQTPAQPPQPQTPPSQQATQWTQQGHQGARNQRGGHHQDFTPQQEVRFYQADPPFFKRPRRPYGPPPQVQVQSQPPQVMNRQPPQQHPQMGRGPGVNYQQYR
jgi:hypothetical protein